MCSECVANTDAKTLGTHLVFEKIVEVREPLRESVALALDVTSLRHPKRCHLPGDVQDVANPGVDASAQGTGIRPHGSKRRSSRISYFNQCAAGVIEGEIAKVRSVLDALG